MNSKDAFVRGKLSEKLFIVETLRFNLDISEPIVDRRGYDFVVHGFDKFHRIQVKSTSVKKGKSYRATLGHGSKSKKLYTSKEIDFFAIHITPTNQWFIIPVSEIKTFTNYFNASDIKHKHTKYLNAWHLFE